MDLPRSILLFVALLSMSISGPTIRFAVAPALAVVVWRVWLAWPVLAGAALARREHWPLRQGLLAGMFLAVHWVTWVLAVSSTSIAHASLLIDTGALWAALLSRPLLGERVSRRQWVGLGLALLGVALVVTTQQAARYSVVGDLLALGGSLAWVGYTFIGRRARLRSGFWGYTATVYLSTSLVTLAAALALRVPLVGYDRRSWIALATLALFPTLLGHGSCNYLLRFIGPAQLSLWTLCEPALATLYAWPLCDEIPGGQTIIGGVVALVGVGLGVWDPVRRHGSLGAGQARSAHE
jgi:drug/metabolite transporter (DMT)-like permease